MQVDELKTVATFLAKSGQKVGREWAKLIVCAGIRHILCGQNKSGQKWAKWAKVGEAKN